MASALELELFDEEFEAVQRLDEAQRWKLVRDTEVPLGVYVLVHPIVAPEDCYKARIRWTNYFGPFSLKFVNLKDGRDDDPTAWPCCYGFRPSSRDVCLPLTAEGHQLHPEWSRSKANAFPSVELPMQHALLWLQHCLDTSYTGRGRP